MDTTRMATLSMLACGGEARPGIASRLAQAVLSALLCLSITLPVINFSESLPWFKIEQLALPVIGVVYLWFLLAGFARPFRANAMIAIAVLYAACVGLALFYGWAFLGHTVLLRDFYEIPKVFLPAAFFTLGLETGLTESSLLRLLKWFSVAMLLVCVYAWAQWMDLGFTHFLANFYSGGSHDEGSLSHYRRVYSTMGNPNLLGQLLTWAIAAFALAALFGLGSRLRSLVMMFACLVTLVMTGSRYGVLNTVLTLVLVFALRLIASRSASRLPLILALIPILIWIALAVAGHNQATMERLETLRDPLAADSFRARADRLWKDAGEEFLLSPLFGHGPAKEIFSGIVTDSEYLDVLKQFGLVGFSVYLLYFVFPLGKLWKGVRMAGRLNAGVEANQQGRLWALRLSLVMVVTALAMNVGMSTFYNPPLQGFLWMWLGIGAASAKFLQQTGAGFDTRPLQQPSAPL